jgi:cytoskeletal protein CcmA (bactofilin family)
MAVFSSGAHEKNSESGSRAASRETSISIVAPGMRIIGELITGGVVKVEGTVEGTIRAEREVLIAKGGLVEGDIHTHDAVVGGKVVGSIFASERVEVQQGSVVQGDIATKRLTVQEGGEVNGSIKMGDTELAPSRATSPPMGVAS